MSYRKHCDLGARLRLGIAGMLGCAALPALAAGWETNPRAEVGYIFDDNYRLDLPGDEIEVSGGIVDAELALRNATQRNEFTLVPRVRATYFPDERDEDSTDYFLEAENLYRTQRSRFALNAGFADETVATSEVPMDDPQTGGPSLGEGGGPDAGRTSVRNRRQLIEFNPYYAYDVRQRQQLELGAGYRNVDFDNSAAEQVAYQEANALVGYAYQQSTRATWTLRGTASWYDPDIGDYDAFGYGLQGEWGTQLNENSRTYVRLGAQRTRIDRAATRREETDFLAGIGGQWSGQVSTVFVDLTRSVGPTASGFVVARDQVRLRYLRSFSERTRGFIGIRGIRDEAAESDVDYAERRYANGNVGFEWFVSRTVAVTASYDYTWQEFDDEADNRSSQGVTVALVYQPRRGNQQ